MDEGFFNLPNKRTLNDVVAALKAKGFVVEGKEHNVVTMLTRRVKSRVLRIEKNSRGQIYWKK
jgi:hypothetical protein